MSRIIVRSEDQLMYTMQGYRRQLLEHADSVTSAVTSAAVQAAFALDVSAIVAFTHSGATANAVSRLRPSLRIFALTPFPEICRRLSIRWGIIPSLTKRMRHTDEMPQLSRPTLEKFGVWRKHSYIAILSGTPVARPGSTNLLKIHEVK